MPLGAWSELVDAADLAELEPPRGELLRHTLAQGAPAVGRRVFTNRNLRMEKIRQIGFDLDWTLANYDHEAMSALAFELTLDRLVSHHGYPRKILRSDYRSHFARRGLMIDKQAGTVLKMNRHRYVGRAYYGREFLGGQERARLYRAEPIVPTKDRFYFVDTMFELPEVNIFSEVVELSRRGEIELDSYEQLCQDVRAAIDTIHADGSLKRRVLADLPRFLPPDPELILALERLALGGRRLLLITNSEWFYTDGLCKHLFASALPGSVRDWRELFDLVVVRAAKPGFFRKSRPFVELEEGKPVGDCEIPAWGKVYEGGGREGLMGLLDCPGECMLYVGDHIYGDIFSSKRSSTWRTALVLQELEPELQERHALDSEHRRLGMLRSELADLGRRMDDLDDVLHLYRGLTVDPGDPATARIGKQLEEMQSEHRVMRHHARRLQERISAAINPYWGSLFKQGSNKSLFGAQVDDFACIYTSRVANFAAYGSRHYYRVLADPMMHET